jgi:hypothetical protein
VVAILDYWSQTVLRAFHDYLFRVLRKIDQDCTFNQGKFQDKTKDWKVFYSIDLTAATDRFPIQFISLVLKGLLPDHYVHSWIHVMIGLPFDFKQHKRLVKVNYEVGNPMGAYSSWNSFTLAHHYIMYWCCKELGINFKKAKYLILGDDVLIGDTSLRNKYLEVLNHLDVEVSLIKSHESSKLFEFAKRLVLNHVEITPFPISSLKESSKKYYLLVNLLMEEIRKGWDWHKGIPLTIELFYAQVLGFNSTFRAKVEEKAFLCELTMKMMRGVLPCNDGLNAIIGRWSLQIPPLVDDEGSSVLSNTAAGIFAEGNPFEYKKGKPLGLLAEMFTIDILCTDFSSIEAAFSLNQYTIPESLRGHPDLGPLMWFDVNQIPSLIPILNIHGQVSELYIGLQKKAFEIDTIGQGNWPMALRTLALPVSDKVYFERTSHTITRVSAILSEKILENLRGHEKMLEFMRLHQAKKLAQSKSS